MDLRVFLIFFKIPGGKRPQSESQWTPPATEVQLSKSLTSTQDAMSDSLRFFQRLRDVEMNNRTSEFARLIDEVREGSEDAAVELLDLCNDSVLKAIRRKLNRQLRVKFDSQDFAQEMWASVFSNLSVVTRFDNELDLVNHLAGMAHNKVIDEFRRRYETQKFDVTREARAAWDEDGNRVGFVAEDPTPSETAMGREEYVNFLNNLPVRYKEVVELHLSGESFVQIAEMTEFSARSVRRIVKNFFPDTVE